VICAGAYANFAEHAEDNFDGTSNAVLVEEGWQLTPTFPKMRARLFGANNERVPRTRTPVVYLCGTWSYCFRPGPRSGRYTARNNCRCHRAITLANENRYVYFPSEKKTFRCVTNISAILETSPFVFTSSANTSTNFEIVFNYQRSLSTFSLFCARRKTSFYTRRPVRPGRKYFRIKRVLR